MSPINILLVEDNEGDIFLTTEALKEGNIAKSITVIKDGWEAVQYLNNQDGYQNVIIPQLILLDINLPKLNGFEVLEKIKSQANLKHIPIIMLSTSSSQDDIHNAYSNHANCYITKPVDVAGFSNIVSAIKDFWLNIAQLPITA